MSILTYLRFNRLLFSDPFVKVQLVLAGKRLKKKKTSTKRNSLNPAWNEALVFSLTKDTLKRIHVEFVVCSDNLLGNNEVLGKVTLGPETSGEESAHWRDMMTYKSATARYHCLHPPPHDSPPYHNQGRRCSDF